MFIEKSIGIFVSLCVSFMALGVATAFDQSKYPDLRGEWRRGPNTITVRVTQPRGAVYDPSKAWGPAQQAPLVPEYQARFEANLADQAAGGQGIGETYTCVSPGMPRVTNAYGPTEFVVTPNTTHILVENIRDSRRIFTDGREWPSLIQPSFLGYSIGKWIDTDDDGKFDTLEVETRGFIGPRAFDSSGIPLHGDNQTVVKERMHLDKGNPNRLLLEVTVIDHALTRPWTVLKSYRRETDPQPIWPESVCGEANNHVQIGKESYMISGDGLLMPTKRGQKAPDLKYFRRSAN
ncbi:MAG TPA: hypothetical protein VH684_22530 [Xanthobacteraceae bacterium]|jgi:hypothetical protein